MSEPLAPPVPGTSQVDPRSPQYAIRDFFNRIIDFRGRSTRPQYWWMVLFAFLAHMAASILGATVGAFFAPLSIGTTGLGMLLSAAMIPLLVRRMRDAGAGTTKIVVLISAQLVLPFLAAAMMAVAIITAAFGGSLSAAAPIFVFSGLLFAGWAVAAVWIFVITLLRSKTDAPPEGFWASPVRLDQEN